MASTLVGSSCAWKSLVGMHTGCPFYYCCSYSCINIPYRQALAVVASFYSKLELNTTVRIFFPSLEIDQHRRIGRKNTSTNHDCSQARASQSRSKVAATVLRVESSKVTHVNSLVDFSFCVPSLSFFFVLELGLPLPPLEYLDAINVGKATRNTFTFSW